MKINCKPKNVVRYDTLMLGDAFTQASGIYVKCKSIGPAGASTFMGALNLCTGIVQPFLDGEDVQPLPNAILHTEGD